MKFAARSPPASPPPDSSIDVAPAPPRRGARLFFVATIVAQASALLRYVVLARILGPEQLGLAATLVVTAAFFDMISETGSDRFLIQDREGGQPAVQELVQLVYVGRGLLIAAGLVIFAIPIAHFYKDSRLAAGIAFLAISPLIAGFTHLDIRRTQRHLDFRSEAINRMAGEGASLIATAVAAWLTRDFTAILYGLITRSIVMVAVSHMGAERRYRLGYSREHGPRLAKFAAPLMLTGLMLFIGSQGDRVVVANTLGVKTLGHYAAVLLLIYYPSAVILNYIHVLYVPLVAAQRDDPAARDAVSDGLGGLTLLLGVAMVLGFAVVAPVMVPILYGGRYREPWLIVGLIGVLQTTRFLIVWPTTVALSMGHSRTVLAGNFVRLLAFPGAYAGAWLFGGLTGVVGGFIVGELVSIAVTLALVNRDTGSPLFSIGFDRFAIFIAAGACVIAGGYAVDHGSPTLGVVAAGGAALVIAVILRREIRAIAAAMVLARSLAAPVLARVGARGR
ncbi:MAG: oligosaccharide flippase family protein [Caulobacteraceae bacterium]